LTFAIIHHAHGNAVIPRLDLANSRTFQLGRNLRCLEKMVNVGN